MVGGMEILLLLVVGLLLWIGLTLKSLLARVSLHGEALAEMGQLVKRLVRSSSPLP
jgi:hypothetical protein